MSRRPADRLVSPLGGVYNCEGTDFGEQQRRRDQETLVRYGSIGRRPTIEPPASSKSSRSYRDTARGSWGEPLEYEESAEHRPYLRRTNVLDYDAGLGPMDTNRRDRYINPSGSRMASSGQSSPRSHRQPSSAVTTRYAVDPGTLAGDAGSFDGRLGSSGRRPPPRDYSSANDLDLLDSAARRQRYPSPHRSSSPRPNFAGYSDLPTADEFAASTFYSQHGTSSSMHNYGRSPPPPYSERCPRGLPSHEQ